MYSLENFNLDTLTEAIREYYNLKPMKRLFQYAVILHEYEKDEANLKGGQVYKDSRVIIEPKVVLAKSEKDLVFKVTREIPEQYAENPDNVEIIIRPF